MTKLRTNEDRLVKIAVQGKVANAYLSASSTVNLRFKGYPGDTYVEITY